MAKTKHEIDKALGDSLDELEAYLRWYFDSDYEKPKVAALSGKLVYFLRDAYKKGYIDGRKEEREEKL